MASRAAALLATLLICCFDACLSEYSSAALSTHLDTLLAEYDREAAPAARVAVTLALDVRHAALDDASATMRLLADLKMSWADSRLAWNASQWEGGSALVSAERLWTPDVVLAGGGRAAGAEGAGLRARLAAGGGASLVRRLDLAVPVRLQLARWPLDAQRADFEFASRAHTADEIDLVIGDHKGSVVVECGAWEVESVTGAAVDRRVEGGARRAASWSVRARRRGAAAARAHGGVLAACALLLAAAAARPPARRAPLALAATLASALWLTAVTFSLPAAPTTPLVVSLMCAMCALGAAAGAGAALAGRLARRAAPPPAALRTLLSKLSHIHPISPDPECLSEPRCGAWAAAAALLDAALAALTVLTLLVLIAVYLLA